MIWIAIAALALLWPAHAIGALDGIPLDTRSEAVVIGVLFPLLCWMHRGFLAVQLARVGFVALLLLKLASAVFLVQEGWCAQFVLPVPVDPRGSAVQLAWDARADWRATVPRCSAVMARAYPELRAFPAWFINVVGPGARPPSMVAAMTIDGYLSAPSAGTLTLGLPESSRVAGTIDGQAVAPGPRPLPISAGVHHLRLQTILTGDDWRVVPRWNDADLFTSVLTTTEAPRAIDRWLWRPIRFATALLVAFLMTWWAVAAARSLAAGRALWIWTAVMGAASFAAGMRNIHTVGRLTVVLLTAVVLLPVSLRLRTARGAMLAIGVPWIALFAGHTMADAGRFTLFTPGDDFAQFQRFAYRIYMEGYWLEGGQWTFWNQPFYRWLIGPSHIVFGDSSIGEWYLDAASLLVGAMFAFVVCLRAASFRWGLIAAATVLATVAVTPAWWIVGRDLSEIAASGFAYAAALLLIDRRRDIRAAVFAGILGVVSFYTRLNNVLWILGLTALLVPLTVSTADLWRPRRWIRQVSFSRVAVIGGSIAAGLVLFAWRTWYYTGVFSIFHGTTRYVNATVKPDDSIPAAIGHMVQSVLMVITVHDPPEFDVRSLAVVGGVAAAALALVGVPRFREVPSAATLFCLAAVVGALVGRGEAYAGRFSIHLIPAAVTVGVCFLAGLLNATALPSVLRRRRERDAHRAG